MVRWSLFLRSLEAFRSWWRREEAAIAKRKPPVMTTDALLEGLDRMVELLRRNNHIAEVRGNRAAAAVALHATKAHPLPTNSRPARGIKWRSSWPSASWTVSLFVAASCHLPCW